MNKKLTSQPQNTIPRVFSVFSSNPKGPNFGLYCKYQLLRYKPWQSTQENAWGDQPGSDEVYISSWISFLQTQYAKVNVPDKYEKLQTLQNLSENETDPEYISHQFPQREEWMHLADLIPGSFVNTTEQTAQHDDNYCDWQIDKYKYPQHIIGEIPFWLKCQKDTFSVAFALQNIDTTTFSDMQANAYNIVKAHSEQDFPKDPLLMIVNGVAGTGKSYLINAIRNLLRNILCSHCHHWQSSL